MQHPSSLVLRLAFAATLLMSACAGVHAQTPPRYALKELVKPLAAAFCYETHHLNESGDVVARCAYKGGTRPITKLWCPLGTLAVCFPYRSTTAWHYELPVVWATNGTTRMLNVPDGKRPSLDLTRITNAGDVIAAGAPKKADGVNVEAPETWIWKGNATMAASLPRPAAVSSDYQVRSVTPGGRVLWSPPSRERPVVVLPDGQVAAVPEMPPTSMRLYQLPTYETYLNDQGMFARARAPIYSAPSAPIQDTRLEAWFYDGQRWVQMPVDAGDSVSFPPMALNAQGHVAFSDWRGPKLWRVQEPGSALPLPEFDFGSTNVINDLGVIGGMKFSAATPPWPASYRATIRMNGTAFDLNTLTTGIPRNCVLHRVMDLNNRGHILVLMKDTTKSDSDINRYRYALLTPQ